MKLSDCNSLQFIIDSLIFKYPKYEKFINKRFLSSTNLAYEEEIAEKILKITGDKLVEHLDAYNWMCGWFLKEEVDFRRSGEYKYTKFKDAYDNVYSKPEIMEPYMKGLLVSQVLWSNHSLVYSTFSNYLKNNIDRIDKVVEVGTGHGLYLATTVELSKKKLIAEGWDISDSSLKETEICLGKLLDENTIKLKQMDIFDELQDQGNADFLIFSEVLEHLEHPREALLNIKKIINDNGRIFLNVPINSPSPDHIYNWKSPEELILFIEDCGYNILKTHLFPATGLTIDRALKFKAALNIVLIVSKK